MRMQICKDERKIWTLVVALLILSDLGCGYGVYHRVRKGETLDDIAKKYNVSKEDILEANRRSPFNKEEFKEGDLVYIPLDKSFERKGLQKKDDSRIPVEKTASESGDKESENKKARETERKIFSVSIDSEAKDFQGGVTRRSGVELPSSGVELPPSAKPKRIESENESNRMKEGSTKTHRKTEDKIDVSDHLFVFPVENGQVISTFGIRNGRFHKGIDIKASEGTPIKAAQDGVVVFSGFLRGYGNTIIIKHEGDYFTVYAHNRYNTVKEGEFVRKGQVIGYVGMTGSAEKPHLHFEVRKKTNPINPLMFFTRR